MPRLSKKDRKIYIDIADCAKRAPEEIKAALKMFGKYSEYAPTYLGLNKSEALVMHSVLEWMVLKKPMAVAVPEVDIMVETLEVKAFPAAADRHI